MLLLSHLAGFGPLQQRHGVDHVMDAVRKTVRTVRSLCDEPGQDPSLLTFLITDGTTLVATQGGKELFVSTHKTRCGDRDECPHLAPECESPSTTGFVNHLLFSSEVIDGENVWQPLEKGDIVGVDWRMRVHRAHVERTHLPTAS